MSFNGSGVYTLPGAQLANGATISATENNQFRNDVAAALNVAWTRDGQAPATANIPMGNHKFTGLSAGTGAGDSVRYEQLPSGSNPLAVGSGGTGATTLTGLVKGNGTSAFTAASAGTDYQAAISATGLLKGAGSGSVSAASAGTDYLAPAAIGTTVQEYAAELQGATQGGINGMKNRIINGAMMIDQRNAGASVTPTSGNYLLDRYMTQLSQASKISVQQNAGSVTPPARFSSYLGITVGASANVTIAAGDYFTLEQRIEGLNIADFAYGTASAAASTLSFWVRSSLTGTFGGAVKNGAGTRSFPFTYTISAANTWEQKTVTITGDTTTALPTNNTVALQIVFSLGMGSTRSGTAGAWASADYYSATGVSALVTTNSATFYITGVQLEKGSTATSFDYRPYGTELALCQRYYINAVAGTMVAPGSGYYATQFPVNMRADPTVVITGGAASSIVAKPLGFRANYGAGPADVAYTSSAEL